MPKMWRTNETTRKARSWKMTIKERLEEEAKQIEKHKSGEVSDIVIGVNYVDGTMHQHYPQNKDAAKRIIESLEDNYYPTFKEIKRKKNGSSFKGNERILMKLHMDPLRPFL